MKVKIGKETITVKIAYIAGFFDGEGCIRIKKANHSGNCYYLWVAITNTNNSILEEIKELFGGTVRKAENGKNKAIYHYMITSSEAFDFLTVLTPFLKEKKKQAELGLYFHSNNKILSGDQKKTCVELISDMKKASNSNTEEIVRFVLEYVAENARLHQSQQHHVEIKIVDTYYYENWFGDRHVRVDRKGIKDMLPAIIEQLKKERM